MIASNSNHQLGQQTNVLARSRWPRIAATAVVTVGLSLCAPLDASAASTTAPSGSGDTSAPASSDGTSGQSSPDYSPPRVQPYALIGAGALVLIAIIWTLRSSGRKGSNAGDGAVSSPPRSGPPPAPGTTPPADLSDE